jgi:uncharacterized protein (TIGR02186 family)
VKALAAAILLFWMTISAGAEQLIVALSSEEVQITSNFTGTSITVFGAIEPDSSTVSKPSFYDIVVAVKGPSESVITRRKDRIAGIWLNNPSRTLRDMPSFYAVNSSRPLSDLTTPQTLERYRLGADEIVGAALPATDPFAQAFIRLKQEAGLYREEAYGVLFPALSVFQTAVQIPANVPVGRYTAMVYLFRDGAMLASSDSEIRISKTGFEQFTYDLAQHRGLIYGGICVIFAIFTGWLAGVIFRRD